MRKSTCMRTWVKHEDPQNSHRKLNVTVCAYNPKALTLDTDHWGFLATSLAGGWGWGAK